MLSAMPSTLTQKSFMSFIVRPAWHFIPSPVLKRLVSENLFGAPVLLNYSNKMSQGRFGGPGFTVTNGFKGEQPTLYRC